MLFLQSCSKTENESREVSRINVLQGSDQCALPGQDFAMPLRIEVCGPENDGTFLSRKETPVVPGVPVQMIPIDDSDLQVEQLSEKTDITGQVQARIRAGKQIGDQYLRIIPLSAPEHAATVRFTVGAKISGGDQEGAANSILPKPVTVRLVNADSKSLVHVPVYFSIKSEPGEMGSARVLTKEALTNEQGTAQTYVQLGNRTGAYEISVEAADPEASVFFRASTVRVLGIDLWNVIITVAGGVTLLFFGMELLSSGLQKIAGDSMKKLLQFFSRNGVMSVLAGTFVTAVIQSSSATTVMVLGFINAGLISLQQAIGIIFGANVGTTITAQLISFNLEGLALPAIAGGFIMTLFKKRVVKGWGESIFGFGMLFFGMSMMSSELQNLSTFPSLLKFFSEIDCAPASVGGFMPLPQILAAMGIGILATALLQSS